MREIKFRGKHVGSGEWMYGYYYKQNGKSYICFEMANVSPNWHIFEAIPETVGQLVSVKAYEGYDFEVELYEGDLVINTNFGGKTPYKVTSSSVGFYGLANGGDDFGPYTLNLALHGKLKKIGNIYDNPELYTEV